MKRLGPTYLINPKLIMSKMLPTLAYRKLGSTNRHCGPTGYCFPLIRDPLVVKLERFAQSDAGLTAPKRGGLHALLCIEIYD